MLITEYRLNLPGAFDVDTLRGRIPAIGAARFDDMPGLGLKAFLLRQRRPDDLEGPVSQYAPFYLWTDAAAASDFFLHGAFSSVAHAYGRPVVRTWLGGSFHLGPSSEDRVTHAVRTLGPLPPAADPAPFAERLRARVAARTDEPGLHSIAWGVDPTSWDAVTIALHVHEPVAGAESEVYEVPHVSTPGMDALTTGEDGR